MARKFKTVEELESYIEELKANLDENRVEIENLKKELQRRKEKESEIDDWFWGSEENE